MSAVDISSYAAGEEDRGCFEWDLLSGAIFA